MKTNEHKVAVMAKFLKDILKYDFIVETHEFKETFDHMFTFLSIQDYDATINVKFDAQKNPRWHKEQLDRFQRRYKLDIRTVSASHLTNCRDLIARF